MKIVIALFFKEMNNKSLLLIIFPFNIYLTASRSNNAAKNTKNNNKT